MERLIAVRTSIAESAKRLDDLGEGDELSKRVKKRILQKLGKLKKELIELEQTVSNEDEPVVGEKRHFEPEVVGDVAAEDGPAFSKEERKLKLRLLNKDLAEFAQKKQLSFAKKRFEWGIRKGIKVDVHSYTNLINAYVRCSDLNGAEVTLHRMIQSGIVPNLVTFTTLMKGYSEMGDVDHACNIYFNFIKQEGGFTLRPNVRALNTFLRACVRTGKCKPALQSFTDFITSGKASADTVVSPLDDEYKCDGSTYEYIIGLLCRAGLRGAAEAILSDFTETEAQIRTSAVSAGGVSVIENTAIYLSLATACALSGDFLAARKWADLTADALKRTETATLKDSMLKRFQASGELSDKKFGGVGGGKEEKGGRSVSLFLQHRRTELEGQLQALDDYLTIATATSPVTVPASVAGAGVVEERIARQRSAAEEYLRCLSQVQFFGFDGSCDYDSFPLSGGAAQQYLSVLPGVQASTEEESNMEFIAGRLLIALRDKFGLDSLRIPPLTGTDAQASRDAAKKSVARFKKRVATKTLKSINQSTGKIDFTALFSPLASDVNEFSSTPNKCSTTDSAAGAHSLVDLDLSELPVKVEICSGDGEWVVAQAEADWSSPPPSAAAATSAIVKTPKALWVALELRCDRIQHTLAHYILSNPYAAFPSPGTTASPLRNLALIGGNAAKIIPERVAAGSIAELFINHPQPPDRVTGGGDVSIPTSSTYSASNREPAAKKNRKDLGKDKNQGAHLLTQEFFTELVRILKVGGTMTIVTDNQAYAKSLAASIATLPVVTFAADEQGQGQALSQSDEGAQRAVLAGGVDRYSQPAHWDYSLDDSYPIVSLQNHPAGGHGQSQPSGPSARDVGGCGRSVDVWRGDPGPEAGHVVQASSYFDRMWDLGQKKRRWFIFVRKIEFVPCK